MSNKFKNRLIKGKAKSVNTTSCKFALSVKNATIDRLYVSVHSWEET